MNESEQPEVLYNAAGEGRCCWGHEPDDYRAYHDSEWGFPVTDDMRLFEKMCLEGFQAGLSWLTILRKRAAFREAFAQFNYHEIARFTDRHVDELLQNKGIVRHRGKIVATLSNAQCAQKIVAEFGSLAAYVWQWEPAEPEPQLGETVRKGIPSMTRTSAALSKDLKKRGWKFFGPTTAYAFMQAMGLVNDHAPSCIIHEQVEQARAQFQRPAKTS